MVGAALTWFRSQAGKPRFLWVHVYDPHAPYAPPEAFGARYKDDLYLGEVAYTDSALAPLLEERRAPPATVTHNPIPSVPRLEAMELGARVAEHRYAGSNSFQLGATARARAVDRMLASSEPPVEWHLWVETVRDAEETRAGGRMGVADTAFYAAVERALARQSPPRQARAAVDFLHGLAEYDFARVAKASAPLLQAARSGDLWLPADLLRDGAVVACLRTGDVSGARAALAVLTPRTQQERGDLRPQLLEAWVSAAERRQAERTSGSR